ncbi:MAG: hypothetical protein M3430_16775 [Acidobacteriota bacterium]|nr:hypothetical protein [Acidobacteriota bacterium]
MRTDDNDATQAATAASAGEMSEAEIDENVEGTFPASDPPSWTLGSNHRSDTEQEPEGGDLIDD